MDQEPQQPVSNFLNRTEKELSFCLLLDRPSCKWRGKHSNPLLIQFSAMQTVCLIQSMLYITCNDDNVINHSRKKMYISSNPNSWDYGRPSLIMTKYKWRQPGNATITKHELPETPEVGEMRNKQCKNKYHILNHRHTNKEGPQQKNRIGTASSKQNYWDLKPFFFVCTPLRKQAYLNILKILPPKMKIFR